MQIVSYGDNLHEMSNPILREKEEKYQLNFARELNVKNVPKIVRNYRTKILQIISNAIIVV